MKYGILLSTIALALCSCDVLPEPDLAHGAEVHAWGHPEDVAAHEFETMLLELEKHEAEMNMGIATSPLAAAGPSTNYRGYRVLSWHGPASQSCEPGRRPAKSITRYYTNTKKMTVAYTECGQIYSNNYNFWFTQIGRFAGDALLLAETKIPVSYIYDHPDFTSDDPENVISDYGTLRTVACYGDCRSLPPQPE